MIITISGVPGSGKTSVAKIIAAKLGLPFYSIGALRGKMAMERGMTLQEFNALGEHEAFTDKDADDYQKKLGESGEQFVIEGRLSWHFIPHSFKIFLNCEPAEAARRIYGARYLPEEQRDDEHAYTDPENAKVLLAERMASDDRRYQKYYGLDYRDPSHYDLVLDTTALPGPEATAEKVLEAIEASHESRITSHESRITSHESE
jgi:cytidylate kinase